MIRMQEVKGAIRWKWSDDGPGGMPVSVVKDSNVYNSVWPKITKKRTTDENLGLLNRSRRATRESSSGQMEQLLFKSEKNSLT